MATAAGGAETSNTWEKQELDGKPAAGAELDGTKEINELPSPPPAPVELPGHALQASPTVPGELSDTPMTPHTPHGEVGGDD